MADPTQGRIVLYTLTADDANQINRRRTSGVAIADRIKNNLVPLSKVPIAEPIPAQWPIGAQAHIGNDVHEGETYPLVIVRVWPHEFGAGVHAVNGQVLLDGNDTYWVTSASESPVPSKGQWNWPPRSVN
jgi:hypothetical protein